MDHAVRWDVRQDSGWPLMPEAHRHPLDPDHRLRPDRDRPGLRVRLLRHPGLPRAARGGLPGDPRQLEPGDDHDRPRLRRRHLRRAAHLEVVSAIIDREQPDALLPTLGGQTGAQPRDGLFERGVLGVHGVEMIGANAEAIATAEDRELFKQAMIEIGLDVPRSRHGRPHDGRGPRVIAEIGLPVVIRPAYILGGRGTGIAYTAEEFERSPPTASTPARSARSSSRSRCRLEGVRARGDARPRRQLRDHLRHRERRPDGRAHRRLDHRRPDPDADRRRVPGDARRGLACIRRVGVETGGSNVQFAVDPRPAARSSSR
jgi:hypothetical protein